MSDSLIHLLHLSDPTLPIGGFSHSAGLETYVQLKLVSDIGTAKNFVHEMLSESLFYNDAAYLSLAYKASEEKDWKRLQYLDQHCNASKLPSEMRNASKKLGLRLIKIFQHLLQNEELDFLAKQISEKKIIGHYCVVFGFLSHILSIDLKSALTGFYFNATVGFVTNCVKLVPLGQEAGQKILFESTELIDRLVLETLVFDEQYLGKCAIGFDIRSMQHETLYSRLYMS